MSEVAETSFSRSISTEERYIKTTVLLHVLLLECYKLQLMPKQKFSFIKNYNFCIFDSLQLLRHCIALIKLVQKGKWGKHNSHWTSSQAPNQSITRVYGKKNDNWKRWHEEKKHLKGKIGQQTVAGRERRGRGAGGERGRRRTNLRTNLWIIPEAGPSQPNPEAGGLGSWIRSPTVSDATCWRIVKELNRNELIWNLPQAKWIDPAAYVSCLCLMFVQVPFVFRNELSWATENWF